MQVVHLSEHALAASDFAQELRRGRQALKSIDVNVRTPAFVGQTAFVMKDGRPKLVDRSASMDSVIPPSRSLVLAEALQGLYERMLPERLRPREPTVCERMLPELGEDGVMRCVLLPR